jgi:fibrillarin-like pre-rRNA processing protein
VVELKPTRYDGVFSDGRDFFTPNLAAGVKVYGEKLLTHGGKEYRRWDPYRSKLAALLQRGCPAWPFKEDTEVLYLGAASGTTASHLSDICKAGRLYCIEISSRVFRKLLDVAAGRPNMMPFLGDANRPDAYKSLFGLVEVVYQDIAQRDQVPIFLKNLSFLGPGGLGFLMVKARSIDVAAQPADIYRQVSKELSAAGLSLLGTVRLDPFQKDHASVVVQKPSGQA